MTAHDLLHRLVDDLDEDDAKLLASIAAVRPSDRPHTDLSEDFVRLESARLLTAVQADALQQAINSGIWSEQAQTALRDWLDKSGNNPKHLVIITLILVAQPPQDLRRQIASALVSWHEAGAGTEAGRARRERVVVDALGSVRAEGLEPSADFLRDSAEYEAGRMKAEDLYQSALLRARSMARP